MSPSDGNASPAGPAPAGNEPSDPDELFAALMRKDQLIVELKEEAAARDGRVAALESALAEAKSTARGEGPGPAMPPAYARMLSERAGVLAQTLAALEADLLTAISPAGSIQRRLAALFAMPAVEGRMVRPHEEVCPSWRLSFEAAAAVRLDVRAKPGALDPPDAFAGSIELALTGETRWLAFETPLSWDLIRNAGKFEASAVAETERTLHIYLCLRLFKTNREFVQHFFGGLRLDSEHCSTALAGDLNLPDISQFDIEQPPVLLFFLSPSDDGLRVRLDALSLAFS